MVAVPDRFEKGVGKTEIQNVLHRFLAKIVVDAEDSGFRQRLVQDCVERTRRFKIPSKGLFHHHACVLHATGRLQSAHHHGKHHRGNGKVMQGALPVLKRAPQFDERGGVFVVAVDITQQTGEIAEYRLVDPAAEFGNAVVGVGAQTLKIPARRIRHADNRRQRAAMPQHVVQRGEYFASGEIARGAKQHQGI